MKEWQKASVADCSRLSKMLAAAEQQQLKQAKKLQLLRQQSEQQAKLDQAEAQQHAKEQLRLKVSWAVFRLHKQLHVSK